mmetsp:Transcript_34042/g.70276  ORF Transcript_34042/g.70276 Transcript_34042/m.70276 type:complete len:240 (+) Transcript_34042:78-797(+)|eukprot:CAMPEP_0181312434 /NCGR_PEP_ID=MMETSP1101-20121128/13696_1 /TAXON_ID=46948 /ORGANISM="Rhodomonas abbreviata, Strain Caron Lab Isolate" /LENGTH=239 /DNA_ID=CAMNT_0023419287 /DNA_START=78 /DNA_END=797 /DNA_ORIENTATION=-
MTTMIKIPSDKVTIGYAPVRGLGAPITMICSYSGEDFDVKHYEGVENKLGVDDWREGWWADKPLLEKKNAFINIPYIVDGETIVSQSNAVLSYLGRKYNLLGSSPAELTKSEQALCEMMDLRNSVVRIVYGAKDAYESSAKAHFTETVPLFYRKIELWLQQQDTPYLAGPTITAPDFHLWEMLDQHELWSTALGVAQPLASYPRLKAFHATIRADPKLQGYFEGPYYKLGCNASRAHFF